MPTQILCTFENEDLAAVALSHLREHGVTLHSAQVHPNQFRQNQKEDVYKRQAVKRADPAYVKSQMAFAAFTR